MNKELNNKTTTIVYTILSIILIVIVSLLATILFRHISSVEEEMPINNNDNIEKSNNIITADVDVKIETKTIKFSCDKLEISNDNDNSDYRLVSFHVNIKNLSEGKLIIQDYEDFYCKVSNKLQTNVTNKDIERKKLSKAININEETEGYITFKVPKDTTIFDLTYKDALLHIELLNNKNAN